MRCRVHVAVEMDLVAAPTPRFATVGGGEAAPEIKARAKLRKIWKCPVPGCREVSQLRPEDEALAAGATQSLCSRCNGRRADPQIYALYSLLRCRECHLEIGRKNKARLNAAHRTRRAAGVGARRGNAASAAAAAVRRHERINPALGIRRKQGPRMSVGRTGTGAAQARIDARAAILKLRGADYLLGAALLAASLKDFLDSVRLNNHNIRDDREPRPRAKWRRSKKRRSGGGE